MNRSKSQQNNFKCQQILYEVVRMPEKNLPRAKAASLPAPLAGGRELATHPNNLSLARLEMPLHVRITYVSTDPMWIMGPSGPTGRPAPTAHEQEKNLTQMAGRFST